MKTRIGERFITKEGYEVVIISYNKSSDVVVEIQDEYKTKVHTTYGNCKKGEIKNPYNKSVYGVACIGVMSDGSKPKIKEENGKHTKPYMTWHDMIKRCYSEKLQEKFPTYKGCSVCKRWLVFANFLEDLPKIENYELWLNGGYEIDKDKKQAGVENKIYSLETVCFIPKSENVKEMRARAYQKKKNKKLENFG
jgi:hypothetical protein